MVQLMLFLNFDGIYGAPSAECMLIPFLPLPPTMHASDLGNLAIFPIEVLKTILLRAGDRVVRVVSTGLKHLFDEFSTTLSIIGPPKSSRGYPSGVGKFMSTMIRNQRKALVSITVRSHHPSRDFSPFHMSQFARSLTTVKGLQRLVLSLNHFASDGAEKLAL